MIWNRKTRYTPYNEWSETTLTNIRAQVKHSKWRMNHHIHPSSGLMNDPNGFSYFNNQWHLFYQVFPFGPVHGLKSWQHLTSNDLVNWHDEGLAIKPDTKFDSHGAYTGTALPVGDKLFIMYTGNVRTDDWQRQSYQIGAFMDKENRINKFDNPLIINAPKGYTTSIRDPYVIKKDNFYFAIIGAQTESEKGAALVYQSNDLKHWDFLGPLNVPESESGFMIECPNMVFIDGKPVFIFCPQGLDKSKLNYQNIYPNVYTIADSIDLKHGKLKNSSSLIQLDDGFDVYATEAINTPDGRALAVSWVGLPEIEYPTDSENWAHCLSVVKELTLKDNHLYQNPVRELNKLRTNPQAIKFDKKIKLDSHKGSFELEITVPADQVIELKVADSQDDGYLKFILDAVKGQVIADRSKTGNPFGEQYGQSRISQVKAHASLKIRLIIDVSVFECYIDNGYSVITGRFFLNNLPDILQIKGESKNIVGTIWEWHK